MTTIILIIQRCEATNLTLDFPYWKAQLHFYDCCKSYQKRISLFFSPLSRRWKNNEEWQLKTEHVRICVCLIKSVKEAQTLLLPCGAEICLQLFLWWHTATYGHKSKNASPNRVDIIAFTYINKCFINIKLYPQNKQIFQQFFSPIAFLCKH